MRRTLSIAFVILGLAGAAFAQTESDEFNPLPTTTVEKSVNLRRGPSTARQRLKVVAPATALRLVDNNPVNGFYRVIIGKGRLGWVWAKTVQPPMASSMAVAPAAASSPCPIPATLDQCPSRGCGAAGSDQAILNSTKRRLPSGANARTLTFADLKNLQQRASDLVGQHNELTQAERDSLANLPVSAGTVREGSMVKVTGFLAQGLDPHANSGGESVNCKLTGTEKNDFHISVVEKAVDDEFKGIVVEMIPQDRNAAWTLAKLKSIKQQKKRILVIGALFYDNIHIVNNDPNHSIGGQPKRTSLWEVHPITKFFVCTKATNNCSPASTGATSGWKALEDF
jgi:uncharacterized protein YgiM (DUF1202 family)